MAADHRHMSMSRLSRRPVLVAMVVYTVAYAAATWAVWREATGTSNYQHCDLVQGSAESVGRIETRGLRMVTPTRHFTI